MSGILGIIGKGSPGEGGGLLSEMIRCMLHEPTYNHCTYINDDDGIYAGWVGHPRSFSDCMPLWNANRDICLLFSGEEFTDQSEIDRLVTARHNCSVDNAAYLMHWYEEHGEKFIERLNGRFSGLLVDLRFRRAILFNDRYGLGRIYYHEGKDRFYFSSEAKSLLRILPHLRRLDSVSLAEMFSCGCALQQRTLFCGVSLLPGGAAWVFHQGRSISKESYFSPEVWENQGILDEAEYGGRLEETFRRVLPRYFRGDQKVGISLTGGVDSRMIMAWTRPFHETTPCYTFGGMYHESNDVKIARQVAAICGQPHEVIPVGQDFLRQFPSLAERTVYLTDGAMDVVGAPDLYVNRRAREIAPIRMTGNYGGEVLRNIVAFKPMPLSEGLFESGFRESVRNAAKTYWQELNIRTPSFIAFKQVPWHHYSRLSLELSQLTVRSPYLDNELVELAFRAPASLAMSNTASLRVIQDGNAQLGRLGTDRNLTLRVEDVRGRIKHLIQEFTFRAEYAFDYGMPHWLAKLDNAVSPLHLERVFLGRHKFYHFRIWYRDTLSDYVKAMLLDPLTLSRPYLHRETLQAMVKAHTRGTANHTLEIHRVLTAELIHRQLIEMN